MILSLLALLVVLTLARRHRLFLTIVTLGGLFLSTAPIFGANVGLFVWLDRSDSAQWISLVFALGVIIVAMLTRRKAPAARKTSDI